MPIDFSTTPPQQTAEYCAATHPGDQRFIAGSIDNEASAYEWRCEYEAAAIADTRYTAHIQGYIWRCCRPEFPRWAV
jgi:hypothetical protein